MGMLGRTDPSGRGFDPEGFVASGTPGTDQFALLLAGPGTPSLNLTGTN